MMLINNLKHGHQAKYSTCLIDFCVLPNAFYFQGTYCQDDALVKGRFPFIAETTRSKLWSTCKLAEQFPIIARMRQFIEDRPSLSSSRDR